MAGCVVLGGKVKSLNLLHPSSADILTVVPNVVTTIIYEHINI